MTEDEAKTKWCPQSRRVLGIADYTNMPDAQNVLCIAAHCMAWRWGAPPTGWLEHATAEQRKTYRPHGFCGLAGKP